MQAMGALTLAGALGATPLVQAREPAELGLVRAPSLGAPGCLSIPYEPVAVYAEPGGLRTGSLVLDHPEYARKSSEKCAFRPVIHLQSEGRGELRKVMTQQLGQGEPGISAYRVARHQGQLWVEGQAGNTRFWMAMSQGRTYQSLERELVQGLAELPELCDTYGRCQPTPDRVRKLARQAGEERTETCVPYAYDIKDVVQLPDGRRAYVATLSEELTVKYAGQLPLEVRVPTYDSQERWTGFFAPERCK